MNEGNREPLNFGRYVVRKMLGEGAMGRVYLAQDPVLQRMVAVKVISLDKHNDERTRQEYFQRFNIEAMASAKLNHPSIVTIYDAGEQDGCPWIAFEFVAGESLECLLQREKVINFEKAKSITLDIASALHHAHSVGIVHRDVKPANILIDKRSGIAKLSDFGVVKAPWAVLTQDGMAVGSPGYMAPEQIDGTGIDARSDLFSLGIVMYQLLSGKHPFLKETLPATIFATLNENYTPLHEIRSDVPQHLEHAVAGLLKADKTERISSAADLIMLIGDSQVVQRWHTSQAPKVKKSFNHFITFFISIYTWIKDTFVAVINSQGYKNFNKCSRQYFHLIITKALDKKFHAAVKDKIIRLFRLISRNRFIRYFLVQRKIYLGAIITCACLIIAAAFYSHFSMDSEERIILRSLAVEGFKGSPSQLIGKCNELIEKKEFDDAEKIAQGLCGIKSVSARSWILMGRMGLKDEDDDDAVSAFNRARETGGWGHAFGKEKNAILADLEERLSSDEASSELIECIVGTLKLGKHSKFRQWVKDHQYWLRWNAVNILNRAGCKVDMVDVYILDLKYGGSIRTRTHAAEKLGEIGNRKAVPVLRDAAARGFADPIVSSTASSVLDRYFK